MTELAADVDQVVAAAAMIGGISYFHEFAFDLLAENERILASTFEAAIASHKAGRLQRIVVLSSSMVFESTTVFPTPEGAERTSPPPISTYGFQKLASEYFAHGAWEQYQLPYTILRPFNCVGIGERRAVRDTDIMSGNVKLALSHVVPDLVLKTLKGQDPLHILGDGSQVRHYTYGGDLAHGIRLAMESRRGGQRRLQPLDGGVDDRARAGRGDLDEGPRPTSGRSATSRDPPFEHDVQLRVPDVRKARAVLGFEATTSLDDDARRGHPVDPRELEARTVCDRALDRRPRLQGGRGGRARAARARRRRSRPRTRSSSSTTSTRTPRSPSSSGCTRSCRPSAACATTSGAACSTR